MGKWFVLVAVGVVACNPGSSDPLPGSDAGVDAVASDGPVASDAATDGGVACGSGKKVATPAMVTSMTAILGGWRLASLRGIDGKDKPLGDEVCDPSIDYYFAPAIDKPLDGASIPTAACAAANGTPIPVLGGTDTNGYPTCNVLSCGPFKLGMLWDEAAEVGRIYTYDTNDVRGTLVATIRRDDVNAGRLLFIQGSTTWSMTQGVIPTCKK
jgi:hypothetical protein